jgi:hypothetical protein
MIKAYQNVESFFVEEICGISKEFFHFSSNILKYQDGCNFFWLKQLQN